MKTILGFFCFSFSIIFCQSANFSYKEIAEQNIQGHAEKVATSCSFILAAGSPLEYSGINSVGLKRRGFSVQDRKEIKNIYNIYFRSKSNRNDNLLKIKNELSPHKNSEAIINFIKHSERGII